MLHNNIKGKGTTNKVKVQRCIRYIHSACNVLLCLNTYIHEVLQFLSDSYVDLVLTELVRFGHLGLGPADLVLDTHHNSFSTWDIWKKKWIHVHHDVIYQFALRLKAIRDKACPVDFFPKLSAELSGCYLWKTLDWGEKSGESCIGTKKYFLAWKYWWWSDIYFQSCGAHFYTEINF